MNPRTITGKPSHTAAEAAISAIRNSISEFKNDAQVIHIIIANLIFRQNKWLAIVSIVTERDLDGDGKNFITFGHLPAKYSNIYDDLLPEVDNLNLIDNDSIWRNIKTYLLDIYFYQAVNFEKLERIRESGGGYIKEKKDAHKFDVDLQIDWNAKDGEQFSLLERQISDEHKTFFKEIKDSEIKILRKDEDDLARNQREGKKAKNLIIKLINS